MILEQYFGEIDRCGTLIHLDEVVGKSMRDVELKDGDFMKIIAYGSEKFREELIQEALREQLSELKRK